VAAAFTAALRDALPVAPDDLAAPRALLTVADVTVRAAKEPELTFIGRNRYAAQ
jgi:hypothetical protein